MRNSDLNILNTDGNQDRATGIASKRKVTLTQETSSSSPTFKKQLLLSKRKSENIHSDEPFSSPSKKCKISTFSRKLEFWCSKDPLSSSDLPGPHGELLQTVKGQGSGGN